MVYYTGHGKLYMGTQRVSLEGNAGEIIFAPIETMIRNFKYTYSKNAYAWGIFDSCRQTEAGKTSAGYVHGYVPASNNNNLKMGLNSRSMGH
jgi:hypothetical protein